MRGMKKNILVVDDDADVLELLREGLSSEKYEILTAQSGEIALKMMQDRQDFVNLVILDIMMPHMDGYEVLKRMQTSVKKAIPVIMLTAKDHQADFKEAFKFDIKFYITKPFSLDKMRKAVRYYLEELSPSEKVEIEETV